MSRSQRTKGYEGERQLVNDLRGRGIPARRVPYSGAIEGDPGDVRVELPAGDLRFEHKWRKDGFATLEDWLDGVDGVVIRRNRGPRLWVFPEAVALRLLTGARDKEAAMVEVLEVESDG